MSPFCSRVTGTETGLEAACPFLSQGPCSSVLDPGRATTPLVLPFRRRGGGLGFTTHFHRLRWDIVLYFDLHVLGFQSGHVQLLQEIRHACWKEGNLSRWQTNHLWAQNSKALISLWWSPSLLIEITAWSTTCEWQLPLKMCKAWKQLMTSEILWKGCWKPLKSQVALFQVMKTSLISSTAYISTNFISINAIQKYLVSSSFSPWGTRSCHKKENHIRVLFQARHWKGQVQAQSWCVTFVRTQVTLQPHLLCQILWPNTKKKYFKCINAHSPYLRH